MDNPNKRKAIFWGLAVVYLLYTIYKLVRNYPNTQGNERVIVTVGILVFVLATGYIIFNIVRVLKADLHASKDITETQIIQEKEIEEDEKENTKYTETHVDNDRND